MSTVNILLPMIRQVYPDIIAQQILGVQPMPNLGNVFGFVVTAEQKRKAAFMKKYPFSRKWHEVTIPWTTPMTPMYYWCEEQFDAPPKHPDAWSRWYPYGTIIRFRDDADYVLYKLRWGV